ncbi:MAG: hypothetical protein Q9M29_09255, partial [Mariprofundaceae bacterium]|nr:hypothetical protein [Mariprofundaceae bacterium]
SLAGNKSVTPNRCQMAGDAVMRTFIVLVLALALAALFALFPDIAERTMSIYAFGWVFEGKQGPFILLLLLALSVFWLLRRILLAILAGPGQLWHVLRSGSKQRKESHLRDGLAEWLDMRGEQGWKSFRKARGFLPAWGDDLLAVLPQSLGDLPLPKDNDDALHIALCARIATDPNARPKQDIGVRKAHLVAWLNAHPGAPLALERQVDLLEEEGSWQELVDRLENIWNHGGSSAARTAPRLASAYKHLAATDTDANQALQRLRKAHRLQADNHAITLALGRALIDTDDTAACRKLWMLHLEHQNDAQVAVELVGLLHDDALKTYRKLEKKNAEKITPALALLRAGLAHAAGLSGLAREHMDKLLDKHPSPQAWQMLAKWQAENDEWQAAAESYRQALACISTSTASATTH